MNFSQRSAGWLVVPVVISCFVRAATIQVPANQPTIQGAIDVAMNGDIVLVAAGTYHENIDFRGKAITVKSASGPKVTIIDGGHNGPVVTFASNETRGSVLTGFTVTNGSGSTGGGIYVRSASPTIASNVITGNTACGGGGGIGIQGGSPLIRANTISNNTQYNCIGSGGAAIEGELGASPEIVRNLIINNFWPEGFGGAVSFFGGGTVMILNNRIQNNSAGATNSIGGGIYLSNTPGSIVQNLITGNVAAQGAGMYLEPSKFSELFVNNTVAFNTGSPLGSALYVTSGANTVQFFNNLLIGQNGTNAVYCDTETASWSPIFTRNDVFSSGSTGLLGTCTAQATTAGNISLQPIFTSGFHLKGGSPGIDVGDNSAPGLPATDLAGNPRIINGNDGPTAVVDMGTYEFVPVTLTPKNLKFGAQPVGSTTTKTVFLTNAQDKTLTISSVTVPTGYSVQNGCGLSISAFASCSLSVTFQPTMSGSFVGTLLVKDSAGNSPQSVGLFGSAP